jgi:lysophospholipase L1-like esterase
VQRVWQAGLVALAVVVFGAAGYVIAHRDTVPNAGRLPSLPPALTSVVPTSAVASSAAAPVVAFLGDDWTAGIGASKKAKRFTTLVSDRLHLVEKNFGADGTGFAKSSSAGGAYRSRVDDIVAAHPDVVVVSGGRNDTSDDATTVANAAKALFATLHRKLPDAKLIAVAPFWGDSDQPPELTALARAVKSGVTDAGGTYLALDDPIHGHPSDMSNAADPNDKGYAAIADALAPQLAQALPGT